jgi:hypothetical protein
MKLSHDRPPAVDLEEFLSRLLFAHLASASEEGPRESPVWFPWEDRAVWIIGSLCGDSFPRRIETAGEAGRRDERLWIYTRAHGVTVSEAQLPGVPKLRLPQRRRSPQRAVWKAAISMRCSLVWARREAAKSVASWT